MTLSIYDFFFTSERNGNFTSERNGNFKIKNQQKSQSFHLITVLKAVENFNDKLLKNDNIGRCL